LATRPALQRHWLPGTLEWELSGLRQWYEDPLDPSWELGTQLRWEQSLSGRSRGEVAYAFGQVWHDDEPERTAEGEPVPGTRRQMQRHELGLKYQVEWGADEAWRLTVRAAGRYATDLASGYYDYVRPAGVLQLRYRRAGWLVEGGLRLRHFQYLTQEAAPPGGDLRCRTEWVAELRAERQLLPWLAVVAGFEHEETFANRAIEEYSVNTLSGGVRVSF
jgi:hypothetical protein